MQTPRLLSLAGPSYSSDSDPQCSDRFLLVPGFVRHMHMLRAADGAEAVQFGFPFRHRRFASHASPLLYDMDGDGQDEIVQANNKGEIFVMAVKGAEVMPEHTVKVQPLRVKKYWFEGLVHGGDGMRRQDIDASMSLHGGEDKTKEGIASKRHVKRLGRNPLELVEEEEEEEEEEDAYGDGVPRKTKKKKGKKKTKKKEKVSAEEEDQDMSDLGDGNEEAVPTVGMGQLSPEAAISMELIHQPVSLREYYDSDNSPIDNPFYAESFRQILQKRKVDASKLSRQGGDEYVFVDSHILATPVIADLDGDGEDELIVSVSYYFDRQFYSDPKHRARLDPDIDLQNYIAGGVVVYDIATKEVKWEVNMDLAMNNGHQSSYVYASPTVADVDSDGNLEVVVGTTLGYIYVLDKHGQTKAGWPQQIDPIRGQVLVEDINEDGHMELCASDEQGTLNCFKHNGEPLWKTKIDGIAMHHMSVGDVDGDGDLDIVLATDNGMVWSVKGSDGQVTKDFFPIKTGSEIFAPVTLMHSSDTARHLDIIVPAFDGNMYIISGSVGQVDKVDFGEHSYAQVLAIPGASGEKMNLVVATMNGNVFSYATDIPYHPLRTVMHHQGYINGFTSRHEYHGIYVLEESRVCRDVVGSSFKVAFEIMDRRKLPSHIPRQYHVTVAIGNKKVLHDKVYTSPGTYVVTLSTPSQRMHTNVRVRMINERRSLFEDEYSVSFNIGFLSLLKWTIVTPILLVAGAVHLLLNKSASKGALLQE